MGIYVVGMGIDVVTSWSNTSVAMVGYLHHERRPRRPPRRIWPPKFLQQRLAAQAPIGCSNARRVKRHGMQAAMAEWTKATRHLMQFCFCSKGHVAKGPCFIKNSSNNFSVTRSLL